MNINNMNIIDFVNNFTDELNNVIGVLKNIDNIL